MDLARLALPRRVCTQSHEGRIVEVGAEVTSRLSALRGLEMIERPPYLPHSTAKFRPVA